MKVYLCSDSYDKIKQSGVGRALEHQEMALTAAGVPYTRSEVDDYDLIHINTVFPASYLKAKKAKRQGKAVVYHAHSTQEDFRNSFVGSNAAARFFGWWIKLCYNTADLVLTPSQYAKELLEDAGVKPPIEVISNGIDVDYWTATEDEVTAFRQSLGFTESDRIILSVGLPIKRKGILDFVALAQRLPDYQFVWCGYVDPKYVSADIQAALAMDLPNLHFPGYINRDQLRIAYQAADLFLFLTHEETEGIVLLEAIASQLDCVVRDISVFDSSYEAGVHLYKGQTLNDFQSLILGILEESQPSLTDQALARIADKRIEVIGQKLNLHYHQALALSQASSLPTWSVGEYLK